MKTKKKFGMRRHIGITAAATLIALGATACEEAYWGGEKNHNTYKEFVNNFDTEDGSFDTKITCEMNENRIDNSKCDDKSACNSLCPKDKSKNTLYSIIDLKVLMTKEDHVKNYEPLVVICSKWNDGDQVYDVELDENGSVKLVVKGENGDDKSIKDICTLDDDVCKGEYEKLLCKEIGYYKIVKIDNTEKYEKCNGNGCGDLDKSMPRAFINAFNYRVCPSGYSIRLDYILGLRNVCAKSVCNDVVVNLYTDNTNCGTCGNNCSSKDAGYTCVSGECIAADKSKVLCNGVFINPKNDPNYCGATGNCEGKNAGETCSGITPLCSEGKCVSTCVGGQIVCDGRCVDPNDDTTYCGAKGTCEGNVSTDANYKGENCANNPTNKLCSGGICKSSCPSGQIACNKKCIDPNVDTTYCGAKGTCEGTTSTADNYQGENCANNATDKLCAEGKCTSSCPSGQIACNKKCIDPKVDTTHCGARGKCDSGSVSDANYRGQNCAEGKKCTGGVCKISCVSGQIECDGECIDPNTNPYFCGATGNCQGTNSGTDCTKSPTNKLCANKTCTSSCPTGQTQCDGFCINMNATNVSSCNNNTIQCKVGYGNCDNDVANGCEVNTSNDNAHCGGCNQKCTTASVPNSAGVQCTQNGCKATSCNNGYVLKDGKCEVSNTLDCCGAKCTNCRVEYPNMKSGTCDASKSKCSLIECNDGYMLNDTKTKCIEVDCSKDEQCGNSGTCNNGKCQCGGKSACSGDKPICNNNVCVACTFETHCPSKLNYTATCKNNTCDYQCNTGYHEDKKNGICVKNTAENCGYDGKCENDTPYCEANKGKCVKCTSKSHCNTNGSGFCDTDTNTCVYTTCSEGYTLSENHDSCVPTKTRCGTSATDCTKIPNILNADSVSCDNGFCVVTSCKPDSNTHVYNSSNGHGQCEANSKDHCGSHDYKCNDANATNISCQNGFCKIEDCNGDYHVCTQKEGVNNGHDICHKNETNECGKSHENCSSFFKDPQCINGVCSGSSCIGEKDGYTKCEKGNEALCLKKEGSWTGNSWPDDCSNCVGASNCSNGKSCKRSWTYGYSYSCE